MRLLTIALLPVAGGCSSSNNTTTHGDAGTVDAASATDGATVTPPHSCEGGGAGLTNCGSLSESCCSSMSIPGGTFYRTYTNTGDAPSGEADPATISSVELDKYEVTVGRFRQFAATWNGGTGFAPPAGSGKHTNLNGGQGLVSADSDGGAGYEPGWVVSDDANVAPTSANLACDPTYATWTASAGANENLPINCVNWYEAYAFCIWDGGFLPSAAEWEYAAAAGNQQLAYPWGDNAPGTGNMYAVYDCYYGGTGPGTCTGYSNIAAVGVTHGAGAWGQLDLSGNVWEWNLDWEDAYVSPCTDCANVATGTARTIRGGFFEGDATVMVPSYRTFAAPTGRTFRIGLRCARTPQ
jgi:formylglycine-generating enzyme required for sulfatase activity